MKDANGKEHAPKGSSNGGQFVGKDSAEKMRDAVRQYSDTPDEDLENMGIDRKETLSDFVSRVKARQAKPNETYDLGKITDRARKDIERLTGQKLNATKHVISATELEHILKRHGEFGRADHSMSTVEDFEDIIDVLQNYDSISLADAKSNFRNGQKENAPIVLYIKKLDNNTQIVAEAITDGKKGKLRVLSAYKTKL